MSPPFHYPFTEATVVHIPGRLHGRQTARLLIQVWSQHTPPQNLDLITTIVIDPLTYDVTVTFEDVYIDPTMPCLYTGERLPPQSGVVLITDDTLFPSLPLPG